MRTHLCNPLPLRTVLICLSIVTLCGGFASARSVLEPGSSVVLEDFQKVLNRYLFQPEMRSFWNRTLELQEMEDDRGLKKHFRDKAQMAETCFGNCEKGFMETENPKFTEIMTTLAKWLDEAKGGTSFAKRIIYFQELSPEDRLRRYDTIVKYAQARLLASQDDAPRGKDADPAKVKAILDPLTECLEVMESLGDKEHMAWILRQRAIVYEAIKKFMEAVLDMDRAMDLWVEAGLPRGVPEYNYLVTNRRYLISQGYDPEKELGGGDGESSEPTRNTGRSWVVGSEWAESEVFKIKADAKLTRFKTPAYTGSSPYCWYDSYFGAGSTKTEAFRPGFTPWGRTCQLVRSGSDVFLDWNGDGKGDVEVKLMAKPTLVSIPKDPSKPRGPAMSFAIATGTKNERMFNIDMNNVPSSNFTIVRYRSASYMEGEILGTPITILDDNDSGIFADTELEYRDGYIDQAEPYPLLDAMVVGKGKVAGPYSEFVKLGEQFHRLKFNENKLTVSARPLDVDTGTLILDFAGKAKLESFIVAEQGEFLGGYFDLAKQKKGVEVPVGKYQFVWGLISNRKAGISQQSIMIVKGNSEPVEVKKGETVTIEAGAPFTFDFRSRLANNTFTVIGESVRVYGRHGEWYAKFFDEVPAPDVAVRVDGKNIERGKTMKRATITEFQGNNGRVAVFHPLDFSIPSRSSGKHEAKLTLKKHKLLGAKIECDWK